MHLSGNPPNEGVRRPTHAAVALPTAGDRGGPARLTAAGSAAGTGRRRSRDALGMSQDRRAVARPTEPDATRGAARGPGRRSSMPGPGCGSCARKARGPRRRGPRAGCRPVSGPTQVLGLEPPRFREYGTTLGVRALAKRRPRATGRRKQPREALALGYRVGGPANLTGGRPRC